MRRLATLLAVAASFTLPAASTPATAHDDARSFTIAATGDILIHGRVALVASLLGSGTYDFTSMLAPIEPWIGDADLAICHLEGTISADNTGLSYYPLFVAPRQIATAIAAAGYDTCSTSSNHAADAGRAGVAETLDVLDAAGLRHDGTARSQDERRPGLYDVNGVTVAHLSYTYGLNGLPNPESWAVNVIDADAILADAAWATQRGAEFVVVSLQWGAEYQVAPTAAQRDLAERLTASPDVDLILGSHAHVVQPIDVVNGKVVVYGMGNHLSNQNSAYGEKYYGTEDGVVVTVTVTEQPDGSFATDEVRFTPTWVRLEDYAVLSASDALATGAGPERLVAPSLERTTERILMLDPPDLVARSPEPWPALICAGRRATITGTAGPDLLVGTPGDDVIVGRGGADSIWGMSGNDLICGGGGDDTIDGGLGWDVLFGDDGADLLEGGLGRDRSDGGPGADRLLGGPDGDALYGGDGDDTIEGGPGDDALFAGPGSDHLSGGDGDDSLVGAADGDRLEPGGGADSCRFGAVVFACG
jgi:poly-gamma-glutamate capsule biosynthesis protein CapA/YwtB (metallophosphatase superfamily)